MCRALVLAVTIVALAGCGGASNKSTKLTMVAVNTHAGRAVFHLSCNPAGGDFANPKAACAALASAPQLVTHPQPFVCHGGLSSWWDVTITGQVRGRNLHRSFSTCWTTQSATLGRLGMTVRVLHRHLTRSAGAPEAKQTAASDETARHKARAATIALAWHLPPMPGIRPGHGRARFLSPTRLAFTTAGSGSCPSLPTSLTVLGRSAIRLRLAPYDPRHTACTLELGTTTVVVALDPRRIDVHRDLTIQLAYKPGRGHVTLIARALR